MHIPTVRRCLPLRLYQLALASFCQPITVLAKLALAALVFVAKVPADVVYSDLLSFVDFAAGSDFDGEFLAHDLQLRIEIAAVVEEMRGTHQKAWSCRLAACPHQQVSAGGCGDFGSPLIRLPLLD